MNKQKIVIFDWGGIVESHENNCEDLNNAEIRFIKRFNNKITDEEILSRWISNNSQGKEMLTVNSDEDIQDWVNLLQTKMNINVSCEEFKTTYEEEFDKVKYYKEVVEYAHSLKDRCRIGILSNLAAFDRKRIDEQYNLSMFDNVFLSFEIGMRKPDDGIYEYVLNTLNMPAENVLFIDDDNDNILHAKKFGIQTCHAFGYELDKIKTAVDTFLEDR